MYIKRGSALNCTDTSRIDVEFGGCEPSSQIVHPQCLTMSSEVYLSYFLLMLALTWTSVVALQTSPVIEGPTVSPLGCHRRMYTYKVTQTDEKGRKCWDNVSVMSCWGRCDSSEISDWKFPYKRSHHPVCVHASRSKAVAMLRNCHDGAGPETRRYEYMEAISCHCHICSSTDTSCEAPNQRRDEKAVRILQLEGPGPEELIVDYYGQ